ncbi:GntR family transcriptional regulator [Shinella sumterensis]|uniref:GntR family transcriptional regulator n=1 Tax=Shinella sumterensis TaxID=1967501 RepID=UPI003F843ED3
MTPSSPVIKRHTVTASVLEMIRNRIVEGLYAGGQQIRQEAIAEEFGVSRIPIREALVQLEAEGFVQIHTHKGAIVAQLTVEDAIDIFEARLILEPSILRQAVTKATPEDISRVQKALQDYERGVAHDASPAQLSQLNWAFHNALSSPSGRWRSLAVLSSLYRSADRYLRLQIDNTEARQSALEDHRAIAAAFVQHDAALAQRLLARHISAARDDVTRSLNILNKGP